LGRKKTKITLFDQVFQWFVALVNTVARDDQEMKESLLKRKINAVSHERNKKDLVRIVNMLLVASDLTEAQQQQVGKRAKGMTRSKNTKGCAFVVELCESLAKEYGE
jgi:hypothetical protein